MTVDQKTAGQMMVAQKMVGQDWFGQTMVCQMQIGPGLTVVRSLMNSGLVYLVVQTPRPVQASTAVRIRRVGQSPRAFQMLMYHAQIHLPAQRAGQKLEQMSGMAARTVMAAQTQKGLSGPV